VSGAELDEIARETGCLRAPVFEVGAKAMHGEALPSSAFKVLSIAFALETLNSGRSSA
jgi:hypothetical protein